MEPELVAVACSRCFKNRGLILDAMQVGREEEGACPQCGRTDGIKLGRAPLEFLAHRFFVEGSFHTTDFGGAPVIEFNTHQQTSIQVDEPLTADIAIFEKLLGIGFFHYGPRLWMVGENTQLRALEDPADRARVVERIVAEYPTRILGVEETFYRVRSGPARPEDPKEYDTPPDHIPQNGRFDADGLRTFYGSPLVALCIHESRFTAQDVLFAAALFPTRPLKLLDLTHLLPEQDVTEFESLDIAVNFVFLAGSIAYPITRAIALAAQEAGFDGLIYPSYYSILMTGTMPFRTTYGISHRRIAGAQESEQSISLPNLALFGRPLEEGKVTVDSINRLVIRRVEYEYHFGPVVN